MGVRRAGFGDESELRAVRSRALRDAPDAFSADYEKNAARTTLEWRKWFSPGATFFFEVAPRDTVGMVAVVHVEGEPDVRQLAALWVSASDRGSGVGDALVQVMLSWSRTDGARIARVQVYDVNVVARSLYDRNGFLATGRRLPADAAGRVEIEMEQNIADAGSAVPMATMGEKIPAQESPSVRITSTMDGQSCAGELWFGHVRAALTSFGIRGCGAALLGPGSEVLGYDDDRSQDHDFGPRLQVFMPQVTEVDARRIEERLDAVLPDMCGGHPVRFPTTTDPVRRHRVTVTTVARFFAEMCGVAPTDGLSVDQWLRTPTQVLAAVTAGKVFADPTAEIGQYRDALAWYPDDVWRYVIGCQWQRLAQHEPFLGRTAETGDDLGARLIAARLTGDLVHLAFLLERRWAPYAKWLGSAFRQLDASTTIAPHLATLLSTASPHERERAYLAAGAVPKAYCQFLP